MVTALEAIVGLLEAITFLGCNPSIAEDYVEVLWKILRHIQNETNTSKEEIENAALQKGIGKHSDDLNSNLLFEFLSGAESNGVKSEEEYVENEEESNTPCMKDSLVDGFELFNPGIVSSDENSNDELEIDLSQAFDFSDNTSALFADTKSNVQGNDASEDTKASNVQKTLECKICLALFSNRGELMTHKWSFHRKEFFKCNECAKEFRTAKTLEKHYTTKHLQQSVQEKITVKEDDELERGGRENDKLHTSELKSKCGDSLGHVEDGIHVAQATQETSVLSQTGLETSVLSQTGLETAVLSQTGLETAVLSQTGLETSVLSQTGLETSVLSQTGLDSGMYEDTGASSDEIAQSDDESTSPSMSGEKSNAFPIQISQKSKSKAEKVKKSEGRFHCPHCDHSYASDYRLQKHLNSVHNAARLSDTKCKCLVCDKEFPHTAAMNKHRRTERHYSCVVCGEGLGCSEDLINHMSTIHPGRTFTCTYCDKVLTSPRSHHNHMKLHTGEILHQCQHCNRIFALRAHLVDHMRSHMTERTHHCATCGSNFYTNKELKAHMRAVHSERRFMCTLCGKRFGTLGQLKHHNNVHTGEKKAVCPICGKRFSSSGSLSIHKRTHTGEKPASCSQCNKSFVHRSDLRRHMLTHTGEKPHKCPECDRSFTQASNLKTHLRTHTGQKPYECPICHDVFGHNVSLRGHMKSHHANNDIPPNTCNNYIPPQPTSNNLNNHDNTLVFPSYISS